MRHGRKTRSVLFDGYKRHVLRDLDTRPGPGRGHHPGQRAGGQCHQRHRCRPGAAGQTLAELHIDRAYLASGLVRDCGPDLMVYCNAWGCATPAAATPKASSPSTLPPGS